MVNSAPEQIFLEAASADEARHLAEKKGYTVLDIRTKGLTRASTFPLLLFCQELYELLQAGLSLTEAIETLEKKEVDVKSKQVISLLIRDLQNGLPFSAALDNQKDIFPNLLVANVKACETTGTLAEGLERFASYLQQVDTLKKRIVSAFIYPSFVIGFALLVVLFLIGYVIPRFSEIYESRATELSFAADLLLQIGQLVQQHGMLLLILAVAMIVLTGFLMMQQSVKTSLASVVLRLPKIGERVRIYHLTRLYRTFAMLLRSGIPVVSSLERVSELLGSSLKDNLLMAKQRISDGESFTKALQTSGLTTPVAEQLFKVGEKAGRLDAMLERAAHFHEQDMLRWIDAFTKVFEPILMAVIGLIIGGIVLLMYLPIFELASGIQ
jgi:general secretion pathway protein F